MNEKRKILQELFAKQRFGIKLGLERTFKLAEYFSNPHNKYITIHVAGTNGKGSVASYLASIFTEAGYKTGLYTSPHLVDFNERIRINGLMISDEDIVSIANDVMPIADKTRSTFFEITTVMAFEYFSRQKIDIAILETGMGGRYDSTNIVEPELDIITSISLDHEIYLGGTIEEIAFEKAGIMKTGVPVIINEARTHVQDIFIDEAKERNAAIYFTDQLRHKNIKIDDQFRMSVEINSYKMNYFIYSPLPGIHQVENLKLVVLAYELLKDKFNLNDDFLHKGISNVKLNTGIQYRTEIANSAPLLIADAAHNPAAILKLRETLELWNPKQKYKIIFGAMQDKNLRAMLNELLPITDVLILTQAQIDRTAIVTDLEEYALEAGFENIIKFDNVKSALDYFLDQPEPGIITGSFYITGEALEILRTNFKK